MFDRKNIVLVTYFGHSKVSGARSIYSGFAQATADAVLGLKPELPSFGAGIPLGMVREFYEQLCALAEGRDDIERDPHDTNCTFIFTCEDHKHRTYHAANFSVPHDSMYYAAWNSSQMLPRDVGDINMQLLIHRWESQRHK